MCRRVESINVRRRRYVLYFSTSLRGQIMKYIFLCYVHAFFRRLSYDILLPIWMNFFLLFARIACVLDSCDFLYICKLRKSYIYNFYVGFRYKLTSKFDVTQKKEKTALVYDKIIAPGKKIYFSTLGIMSIECKI